MTKKTFEAVAGILCGVKMPYEVRSELIEEFSELFSEENDRFDAEKFADACTPANFHAVEYPDQ